MHQNSSKLTSTHQARLQATTCSALWAAYGDALGFITELTNAKGLKWRTGVSEVNSLMPWRRKVGGAYGVEVKFPSGTYSDDTQLRLATSRAIRGDGTFDVEAFSKVELPVWCAYALGAGRGSKLASQNLAKNQASWFNNFYKKGKSSYFESGGNGAAMRIQPHVWSAREGRQFLLDVFKNAICTHGHPRGIVGALFHAMCLSFVFRKQAIPGPAAFGEFLDYLPRVLHDVQLDVQLGTFWLPGWEQGTGRSFSDALDEVVEECRQDIAKADTLTVDPGPRTYFNIVEQLNGFDEKCRGSGTKTSIIAALLAYTYREKSPEQALKVAANQLGTDTDSIATMAGALLGGYAQQKPSEAIQDEHYILSEAERMWAVSCQLQPDHFQYPDLLSSWSPPRTQAKVLGELHDGVGIAGLGKCELHGEMLEGRGKRPGYWQWARLHFGQTVLVKRYKKLSALPVARMPAVEYANPKSGGIEIPTVQRELFVDRLVVRKTPEKEINPEDFKQKLEEMIILAEQSGFEAQSIGKHIKEIMSWPDRNVWLKKYVNKLDRVHKK